jgi:cyclophilin family peptidyl-prolyl cis-trans isomerase/HEAT repeat protein
VRHWKRRSSLLGLLLGAAFADAGAQRPVVTTQDAAWLARILRIEDTRRDEPAFVDSLLEHGSPIARARAALAAGRIGSREHVSRLRRRAAEPDTAVAATAWFALALLRDTGAVSVAASALPGPPSVAIEAACLLGDVGEAGRSAIIAALADSSLAPSVRGALLLAAARLRPVPAVAVAPWVTSGDSGVAWRAAYVLSRGRSAAGVRALLSVVNSPMSSVREQVARGLSRSVTGDSLGDSALAVLHVLATDREPRVRVNAVRSLASYGPPASREVSAALRDADAGVRVVAAQSLGMVLDSAAAPWESAFGADTSLVFRQAIADGAAAHGVALTGTQPWPTSPDWHRRAVVIALDARGVAADAALRLQPWFRDRDARVRATAAAAMGALMDSATAREVARASLREALGDSDPFVRAAALVGLSSGASTTDLSLAVDSYVRSAQDRDADARLAFWQLADSALARAGSALPGTLAARLRTLRRPDDPLERIAASRIPLFAAWADSAGTARPLAWYEARAREVIRRPERIARIETDRGPLELTLFAWDAPLTVYNFTSLANRHYFDGQRFHRVVPNFVIQAGDPRGDGNGGPGYAIRDEINRHRYGRGTLGMALSGPNTGGSQWFVTHSPQPHLDGGYTIFGQLRSGTSALDHIVQGDRIVRITVR